MKTLHTQLQSLVRQYGKEKVMKELTNLEWDNEDQQAAEQAGLFIDWPPESE